MSELKRIQLVRITGYEDQRDPEKQYKLCRKHVKWALQEGGDVDIISIGETIGVCDDCNKEVPPSPQEVR